MSTIDCTDIRPATRTRRASSISVALRKLSDCFNDEWDLSLGSESSEQFRVRVAADRESRRRAYALAHRVYRGCGYAENDAGLLVSSFDAAPHTLTLLARDASGRDAATVTLIPDSSAGLPSDEIFGPELDRLRSGGRRLAEITRLAIGEEHQHAKVVLLRLFNLAYIYARRVKGADDCVIEVNPRHAAFYRRLLMFEQIGAERPCPRVCGAPAVLYRLNFAMVEQTLRRRVDKFLPACDRTLYSQFYSFLEEGAVAQFMLKQHAPMSAADAGHFGIAQPSCRLVESQR